MNRPATVTRTDAAVRRRVAARMQDLVAERREDRQPSMTLDDWAPSSSADAAAFLTWAIAQGNADFEAAAHAWVAWFDRHSAEMDGLCTPLSIELPDARRRERRTFDLLPWARQLVHSLRPLTPRAPASLRLRMV